jgi:hypothetical protein
MRRRMMSVTHRSPSSGRRRDFLCREKAAILGLHDGDDVSFDRGMGLFYGVRSACTLGRFIEGLDLHSALGMNG